ncbi:MAG: hypothetical protein C0404_05880 [Verrucomicrobia bacterium]|nr:hypothetical protein [Verrucomicrobiota bacterium]
MKAGHRCLKIVPRPKIASARAGMLDISGDVPLFLSPHAGNEEFNAALSFAREARPRCRAELPIEKSWRPVVSGRHIRFLIFDRDRKIAPSLAGMPRPRQLGAEGYVIEIDRKRVVAAANTPRGLFYAAQTLRQLCRVEKGRAALPCCRIVDWPDFRYRGVMLDVSRFKVPRLDTLKWLAQLLASLKVNVFQLYIEHPFKWRKHPAAGAGVSPFAAEELMVLDQYCKTLGMELQANQQSFGHHNHILSQPGYGRFAEVPEGMKVDLPDDKRHLEKSIRNWSFSPAVPGSYGLIGELYDEALPLYESKLFNANCDETWDIGYGRSKRLCERRGVGAVYVDHVRMLHRMAAERGKRLMIWCDTVLHHPELIRTLPKDILALDWGYDALKDRTKSVRKFAKSGLEFWVCPGVATWTSIFARTDVAQMNIRKFAEAGKKHGATGLLNTDWGDDGHSNLQGYSLHGYAYGAEQSWNVGEAGDGDFDSRFAWAVFRDPSGRFGRLFRLLGRTMAPFGPNKPLDYTSYPFVMLWTSFRKKLPLKDHPKESQLRVAEERARLALELINELRREFKDQHLLLRECEFAAKQTLAACRRGRVFESASAALRGKSALTGGERRELSDLRKEWSKFRTAFEELWMARSRRSQINYRLRAHDKLAREYDELLGKIPGMKTIRS